MLFFRGRGGVEGGVGRHDESFSNVYIHRLYSRDLLVYSNVRAY